MSSTYGKNIKISIFGQSHSKGMGVSIDGLPAGKSIDEIALQKFMSRRAPGQGDHTTSRKEADQIEILSGIIEGKTCGAPIGAIIHNMDTISEDYKQLVDVPRPSHADFTSRIKYKGFQDIAGGGHFSGRLTAPLCIAGGICKQLLEQKGIRIEAQAIEVGGSNKNILTSIAEAKADGDSVGGIIECLITGMPVGVGEPMFDGIENKISQTVFAVPAIKGIEFGNGFAAAKLRGSQNNDNFILNTLLVIMLLPLFIISEICKQGIKDNTSRKRQF